MRPARLTAALALLALPGLVACSSEGELMLAIQTDLGVPKDINHIQVKITNDSTGVTAYDRSFDRLGAPSDKSSLPMTIGLLAPRDPSNSIRIKVIGDRQSKDQFGEPQLDGGFRAVSEVVTTVPVGRVATLPITIEFLCDGKARAERGADGTFEIKSTCPAGLTCVEGECVEAKVDSATLSDYDPHDIFGGGRGPGDGSCFDASRCFERGHDLTLDAGDPHRCTAKRGGAIPSGEINVGLRTQGDGICGATGCFVALNHVALNAKGGWSEDAQGTIHLPAAVCKGAAPTADGSAPAIVGVVAAPVAGGACQQKRASLPLCRPASDAAHPGYVPAASTDAVALAAGQPNPVSLSLAATSGDVYWINHGTFDAQKMPRKDGAVIRAHDTGGKPRFIAAGQATPNELVIDGGWQSVFWTNAADGTILSAPFPPPGPDVSMGIAPTTLLSGLGQPSGLALSVTPTSHRLYWTEIGRKQVSRVDLSLSKEAPELPVPLPMTTEVVFSPIPLASPRAVAAAADGVCWTDENTLMAMGGVVACNLSGTAVLIAEKQSTPRAILLDVDQTSNHAAAVYWLNFDSAKAGGGIYRALIPNGNTPKVELVVAEDYPGGFVKDPSDPAHITLYWTSRSKGTVNRGELVLSSPEITAPEELSRGQVNPGAIAVGTSDVFWINQGTTDASGLIMKRAKK